MSLALQKGFAHNPRQLSWTEPTGINPPLPLPYSRENGCEWIGRISHSGLQADHDGPYLEGIKRTERRCMRAVTGVPLPRCQTTLVAIDVGSNQEDTAARNLFGCFLLLLLLVGIGTLVFLLLQDLMRGALIETPGLCIWV